MSRLEAALRRAMTPDAGQSPKASLQPSNDDGLRTDQTPLVLAPADAPAAFERPRQLGSRSFNPEHAEKLIVSPEMPPEMREQYRRIAAMLHHAQTDNGLKVLMIASAVSGEGKSLTSTNIALTLSESYHRRVLLIDADLRRPSLDGIFQIPRLVGLNDVLTSTHDRKASLVEITPHLSVLPAGRPNPDPMSALTSERMKRLIAEAAVMFDWVILDTSPVGVLTDANLLGAIVQGALLVIRAGSTPAALVKRAVEAIGQDRILGVVLNQATSKHGGAGDPYYSAHYYQDYVQGSQRGSKKR